MAVPENRDRGIPADPKFIGVMYLIAGLIPLFPVLIRLEFTAVPDDDPLLHGIVQNIQCVYARTGS